MPTKKSLVFQGASEGGVQLGRDESCEFCLKNTQLQPMSHGVGDVEDIASLLNL